MPPAEGSRRDPRAPGPAAVPAGSERREFFRVTVRIPLRHRPVRPHERAALEREILAPRNAGLQPGSSLGDWARRIEDKLDLILSHLDERVPAPLGPRDLRVVELSGSGMRLAAKETAKVGAEEFVELRLPGEVPRDVRAITTVVKWIEARGAGEDSEVALAFRIIHEEDRDAIVRFSNEVQRSELRLRADRGRGA